MSHRREALPIYIQRRSRDVVEHEFRISLVGSVEGNFDVPQVSRHGVLQGAD